MIFLIVSHVEHKFYQNNYWAYGPYIREMNLWEKHIDQLIVVAPLNQTKPNTIDLPYDSKQLDFRAVPSFNGIGIQNKLVSLTRLPFLFWKIFLAMREADHIHLRCPGNVGLLGCMVQVFFPSKKKTAKYAGNWDWKSKQPWSYRIQQKILRNTLITQNMQTLVYGNWQETKNIKPFFTASYSEKEIFPTRPRDLENDKLLKLIFVGALHEGKRPMLSLEAVKQLRDEQINCEMNFYGDGPERNTMENYINLNHLNSNVKIHGNVDSTILKQAYQQSHFLLFISMSEGWPKVVAESMFWCCLPLTSAVSCLPEMIGYDTRGDLIEPDVKQIVEKIKYYLIHPETYRKKCEEAMQWSRQFTLEKFEDEIKKLL
jgi:glycosyltransferase involved in cell wall biosynthesis